MTSIHSPNANYLHGPTHSSVPLLTPSELVEVTQADNNVLKTTKQ